MLRTCDKFLKHTFDTFSPSRFDRDYQLNETNLASFQAKLTLKGNFVLFTLGSNGLKYKTMPEIKYFYNL